MVTTFLEKGQRQRDVHIAVLPAFQNDVRASLIEDVRLAEGTTRVERHILPTRLPDKRPQAPVRVALLQRTRNVQVEQLITPAELKALPAKNPLGDVVTQHGAELPHSASGLAADSPGREVDGARADEHTAQAREVRRIRPPPASEVVPHPVAPLRHNDIRMEGEDEVLPLQLNAPLLIDPDPGQPLAHVVRSTPPRLVVRNPQLHRRSYADTVHER